MPTHCKKILVINPNTSLHMTRSLERFTIKESTKELRFSAHLDIYTAPTGPASINNEEDALKSAEIVFADLLSKLDDYDAYLVACYSVHPLVEMIKYRSPNTRVIGIFEASIAMAISFLPLNSSSKFGIVSTGSYWEKALSDGVINFLGSESTRKFKGVETTGLTAGELHSAGQSVVHQRMKEATKRLIKDRDVTVICLGCAGMAGMESVVEDALREELGEEGARRVYILDGVIAGIGMLEGMLRALPSKKEIPREDFMNPELRANKTECDRPNDPCT